MYRHENGNEKTEAECHDLCYDDADCIAYETGDDRRCEIWKSSSQTGGAGDGMVRVGGYSNGNKCFLKLTHISGKPGSFPSNWPNCDPAPPAPPPTPQTPPPPPPPPPSPPSTPPPSPPHFFSACRICQEQDSEGNGVDGHTDLDADDCIAPAQNSCGDTLCTSEANFISKSNDAGTTACHSLTKASSDMDDPCPSSTSLSCYDECFTKCSATIGCLAFEYRTGGGAANVNTYPRCQLFNVPVYPRICHSAYYVNNAPLQDPTNPSGHDFMCKPMASVSPSTPPVPPSAPPPPRGSVAVVSLEDAWYDQETVPYTCTPFADVFTFDNSITAGDQDVAYKLLYIKSPCQETYLEVPGWPNVKLQGSLPPYGPVPAGTFKAHQEGNDYYLTVRNGTDDKDCFAYYSSSATDVMSAYHQISSNWNAYSFMSDTPAQVTCVGPSPSLPPPMAPLPSAPPPPPPFNGVFTVQSGGCRIAECCSEGGTTNWGSAYRGTDPTDFTTVAGLNTGPTGQQQCQDECAARDVAADPGRACYAFQWRNNNAECKIYHVTPMYITGGSTSGWPFTGQGGGFCGFLSYPSGRMLMTSFVASGTVESFDTAAFGASLAAELNVSASDVIVTAQAASILVSVTIVVPEALSAALVTDVNTLFADPQRTQSALGVTVESFTAPTLVDFSPPPPSPPRATARGRRLRRRRLRRHVLAV